MVEVTELWMQYKGSGGIELRNRLAEHYLPLAEHQSEKIHEIDKLEKQGMSVDDVVQLGHVVLVEKAIPTFDTGRSFPPYLFVLIKRETIDEGRRLGSYRTNRVSFFDTVDKYREKYVSVAAGTLSPFEYAAAVEVLDAARRCFDDERFYIFLKSEFESASDGEITAALRKKKNSVRHLMQVQDGTLRAFLERERKERRLRYLFGL